MADVSYLLQIQNPAGQLVAEVGPLLDLDAGRSINTPAALRVLVPLVLATVWSSTM